MIMILFKQPNIVKKYINKLMIDDDNDIILNIS